MVVFRCLELPWECAAATSKMKTNQEVQVGEKRKEQRAKRRYVIERDVKYRLLSGSNVAESGMGRTLDISSSGVAFTIEKPLAVGTIVELSVSWPALLNNSCAMKLMLFGRVVRSDSRLAAMTIERYEFRTQGRAIPQIPLAQMQQALATP